MGRKNEIKKDIWKILRDVYGIHEGRDITDKQNEFLDKVVNYLDENISLRRKVVKDKPEEEVEEELSEALERPETFRTVEMLGHSEGCIVRYGGDLDACSCTKRTEIVIRPAKKPKKEKKVAAPVKTASAAPAININALPPHLRKYAVQ